MHQHTQLEEVSRGCHGVLDELEKTLTKYQELQSKGGSLSDKTRRSWKRLMWEPEEIRGFRERITSTVTLLHTLLEEVSRYIYSFVSNNMTLFSR